MSCNCTTTTAVSPSGECLPTVADDCAVAKDTSLCQPCYSDPECLTSDQSDGTTLANTWLDACCHNEGVILIGRSGSKLAKFTKSGFLKIDKGYASVVSAVPLSLTTLWHRIWKTTSTTRPILGAPLPYTYQVVGSATGEIHGIKGPADEDAVSVWDSATSEFTQMPLSEVPLPRKGVLARASNIELTGYAPIAEGGLATAVREQKALSGKGLVLLTEVNTIDSTCECADQNGTASVTTALTPPSSDGVYNVIVTVVGGVATFSYEEQ